MQDILELSDFEPYLNQAFSLQFTPEVSLPAVLIEARSIKSYTPAEREPFKLIFRTDQKDEYYNQAIVMVKHPSKGDQGIFLVPVGPDAAGMRYEAIFS
jgi:hypothetical protein